MKEALKDEDWADPSPFLVFYANLIMEREKVGIASHQDGVGPKYDAGVGQKINVHRQALKISSLCNIIWLGGVLYPELFFQPDITTSHLWFEEPYISSSSRSVKLINPLKGRTTGVPMRRVMTSQKKQY